MYDLYTIAHDVGLHTSTGTPTVDQIPGKVTDPTPERADGSVREVGSVSARDVRCDTGWEPAGGSVRAHIRILGGVLARDPPARHPGSQWTAAVDQADQELAEHGHAHHVVDDEQLPAVRWVSTVVLVGVEHQRVR